MKKVVLGILFIVSPVLCMAQESRTEYNFLRLPVSAHAAALGGDNITLIADDASLLFNNPALLGSVSDKTLNLNYMNYMSGVQFGSAAYVRTTGKQGTVAATVQYINYGKMAETDENNIKTGEFSAKDIVLGGTFSYELSERIIGGITAKFITSYIGDYNSLAVGVDLGINYYDPDRQWSLSAVAKNLGGQLKAYNETYANRRKQTRYRYSFPTVGCVCRPPSMEWQGYRPSCCRRRCHPFRPCLHCSRL